MKLKNILHQKGTISAEVTMQSQKHTVANESKIEKEIELRIGVFFDGTQNNMYNTKSRMEGRIDRKNKGETDYDSYFNDYSNVAKLWGLYQDDTLRANLEKEDSFYIFPVYVQGIGTLRGKTDQLVPGVSMGIGSRGVVEKVNEGCELIAEQIKEIKQATQKKHIKSITVDVFGFSRGSAAARHFINEVTILGKPGWVEERTSYDGLNHMPRTYKVKHDGINSGGALGEALKEQNIEYIFPVEVNFVGLFDCVASIANVMMLDTPADRVGAILAHGVQIIRGGFDFSGANNDEGNVNMYLAPDAAKKVVHLVAADEKRLNFPLTAIGEGETIVLPGVHSDIGGGYVNGDGENVSFAHIHNDREMFNLKSLQGNLIAQGWYDCEDELPIVEDIHVKTISSHRMSDNITIIEEKHYNLIGKRQSISTEYSIIPLLLMLKKARESNVPFNSSINDTKGYGFNYHLKDSRLKKLKEEIFSQATGSSEICVAPQDLKWLRHEFLHQSANIDRLLGKPGHGVLMSMEPAPNSKRIVHPNQPKD